MKRTQPPVSLRVGPSLRIGAFVAATHSGTLWMTLWLAIERPLFLLFLPALLFSLIRTWHWQVRGGCRLLLDGSGEWNLFDTDGQVHKVRLQGNSRVWPGLMILNFRLQGGGRRTLILLSDNSDAEQRRRLRVRLLTFHT